MTALGSEALVTVLVLDLRLVFTLRLTLVFEAVEPAYNLEEGRIGVRERSARGRALLGEG